MPPRYTRCTCAQQPQPHQVKSSDLVAHKLALRDAVTENFEPTSILQRLSDFATASATNHPCNEISPVPQNVPFSDVIRSAKSVISSTSTSSCLSGPPSPSENDSVISESFISHATSPPPSPSPSPSPPPSPRLSPNSLPMQPEPVKIYAPDRRVGQQDRSLAILDRVESRAQELQNALLSSSPPDMRTFLGNASKEVVSMRRSLDPLPVDLLIVKNRKEEILPLLREIENRISLLGADYPDIETSQPVHYDCEYAFSDPTARLDTIAQVMIILGVVCNVVYGLSRDFSSGILELAQMLVTLSMATCGYKTPTPKQSFIVQQLPPNVQAALKSLSIDSRTTIHARCPACNYVISPDAGNLDPIPHYAELCPNRILNETGSTICNTPVLEDRDGHQRPILPYLTASITDHLARELTNPDVERYIDTACDDAMASVDDASNDMRTPFHGNFLKTFKGPDGRLFIDRNGSTTAKVAYGFHFDSFNPNGNKKRGNSDSLGMLSLANLALPDSIRNLPEHLLLCAIIPGPREPNAASFSYYLRPIIDEFVVAWDQGYHLSRTALHSSGRLTHYAIVISINDLIAARKISGMPGATANRLCTVCKQFGRDQIFHTDCDSWVKHDPASLRAMAYQWRDAPTSLERERLFEANGVRWSEFWRLPYWDPTRMLILDPMHTILEGLVHYHCRHVLRLDQKFASQASVIPAFDYTIRPYGVNEIPEKFKLQNVAKELKQIDKIGNELSKPLSGEGSTTETSMAKALKGNNVPALRYVCYELLGAELFVQRYSAIVKPNHKKAYIELLLEWRKTRPDASPDARPRLTTCDTLEYIRNVIKGTTVPTYISSVPKRYGLYSAGSVKADEWRTLSCIFLPIALITLWGDEDGVAPPSSSHQMTVLVHTMALFQATIIMCKYSTSPARAQAYRHCLRQWVDNLRLTHPHTNKDRRPLIHGAFHIFDALMDFGAVMSWWTFPFERLVGRLQQINTNDIIGGPLEATMLRAHLRGANIRRWLSRTDCPAIIKQIKLVIDKAFSIRPEHPIVLNDGYHQFYNNGKATFSIQSWHEGNSIVLYYPTPSASKLVAGCIQEIYAKDGTITLSIRRQSPLPSDLHDPFSQFPYLNAKSYSSGFDDEPLDSVPVEDVVSHGAKFTYSQGRCVIINLCRD